MDSAMRISPISASVLAALSLGFGFATVNQAGAMEAVRVASDGKSFVLAESGRAFRVWGVNYDHDSKGENGRLLEDYWDEIGRASCRERV